MCLSIVLNVCIDPLNKVLYFVYALLLYQQSAVVYRVVEVVLEIKVGVFIEVVVGIIILREDIVNVIPGTI